MSEDGLSGETPERHPAEEEKRQADTVIALGAGIGAVGAVTALATGAVCPLCVFIAPGLVGLGAYKRWRLSKLAGKDKPR